MPNLARIVSQMVRVSPDAVALVADGPLTYADVENRALTYANGLGRLKLAPESTIGVLVPRDQELVPLLLAVLWSGAAYVPIDPAEPASRAIRMLSLAGCAAVICDEFELPAPQGGRWRRAAARECHSVVVAGAR